MKRLTLNPEPRWIEIDPELSVAVRPLSPFDLAELLEGDGALAKLGAAVREGGATATAGAALLPVREILDLVGRVAEMAIVEWTVCDDSGQRLPVSAEIARAMVRAEPDLVAPFIEKVLAPAVAAAEALAAEKNVSAPSPVGSTAGATTTAQAATASALTARPD